MPESLTNGATLTRVRQSRAAGFQLPLWAKHPSNGKHPIRAFSLSLPPSPSLPPPSPNPCGFEAKQFPNRTKIFTFQNTPEFYRRKHESHKCKLWKITAILTSLMCFHFKHMVSSIMLQRYPFSFKLIQRLMAVFAIVTTYCIPLTSTQGERELYQMTFERVAFDST